jgi:hypothetical protein
MADLFNCRPAVRPPYATDTEVGSMVRNSWEPADGHHLHFWFLAELAVHRSVDLSLLITRGKRAEPQ